MGKILTLINFIKIIYITKFAKKKKKRKKSEKKKKKNNGQKKNITTKFVNQDFKFGNQPKAKNQNYSGSGMTCPHVDLSSEQSINSLLKKLQQGGAAVNDFLLCRLVIIATKSK